MSPRRGIGGALAAAALAGSLAAGCADNVDGSGKAAADKAPKVTAPKSIEELKARVQGRKVAVASAAFPNPTLVGMHKVLDYLRSDFGMDVSFRLMDSSPMNAALISGKVQVGHVSLAGMAAAAEAGAGLVAVAGNDQKNPFLVSARTPVKSLAELRGKPFAISQNLSSIVGQTADKCFRSAGMDVKKDLQLLHLANVGQIVESLQAGKLAGGMSATFRQAEMDLEKPGRYAVLCKGWEANPQLNDVWAVRGSWLKDNSDVALALAIAEIKAARWARDAKAEWIPYAISKIDGLTKEAAERNYRNLVTELNDWPVEGSLDRGMCDYTLRTSLEFGVIRHRQSCSDLVRFDYQEAARGFWRSR